MELGPLTCNILQLVSQLLVYACVVMIPQVGFFHVLKQSDPKAQLPGVVLPADPVCQPLIV